MRIRLRYQVIFMSPPKKVENKRKDPCVRLAMLTALPLVLAAVALWFAVAPHVGREAEALRAEERVSHTRVCRDENL